MIVFTFLSIIYQMLSYKKNVSITTNKHWKRKYFKSRIFLFSNKSTFRSLHVPWSSDRDRISYLCLIHTIKNKLTPLLTIYKIF